MPVSSLENVPSWVPGAAASIDAQADDVRWRVSTLKRTMPVGGRRAAGAVVEDGAERDRGAGCGETAVEALGELRAVVGGLCGEGQRQHRDGAEAGGAAEAPVGMLRHDVPPCRSVGGTFSSQEYHRAGRELGAPTGLFTDA